MLSPADLLAFCNRVREAGGAETIDELMPGVSRSASSCLIARNLNFDCMVAPEWLRPYQKSWVMASRDVRINDIARALGIDTRVHLSENGVRWSFVLPQRVSNAAEAFDQGLYPPELYEGF